MNSSTHQLIVMIVDLVRANSDPTSEVHNPGIGTLAMTDDSPTRGANSTKGSWDSSLRVNDSLTCSLEQFTDLIQIQGPEPNGRLLTHPTSGSNLDQGLSIHSIPRSAPNWGTLTFPPPANTMISLTHDLPWAWTSRKTTSLEFDKRNRCSTWWGLTTKGL